MKLKILFDISVGSHFPISERGLLSFPIGGHMQQVLVEFETIHNDPRAQLHGAFEALRKQMSYSENYHIWYWTWITDNPVEDIP